MVQLKHKTKDKKTNAYKLTFNFLTQNIPKYPVSAEI